MVRMNSTLHRATTRGECEHAGTYLCLFASSLMRRLAPFLIFESAELKKEKLISRMNSVDHVIYSSLGESGSIGSNSLFGIFN